MAIDPHRAPQSIGTDVRAALKDGMALLARRPTFPLPTLAAELLLMHALGRDRTWLYSHPESELDASAARNYFGLIARRAAGEPTQYLTGKQEFWGLEFEVTPAVLIPRPETEHVIEVALERLGPRGIKINMRTGRTKSAAADCRRGHQVTGVWRWPWRMNCLTPKFSPRIFPLPALEVARRNAAGHGVLSPHSFFEGDLLKPVSASPGSFDLIVSNPPYVAQNDAATLAREVREHEPHAALFGGPSGIEIYARLIEQAGPSYSIQVAYWSSNWGITRPSPFRNSGGTTELGKCKRHGRSCRNSSRAPAERTLGKSFNSAPNKQGCHSERSVPCFILARSAGTRSRRISLRCKTTHSLR